MTFSSDKLNEKIRILTETLQASLNAISYLLSEDASNTEALNQKTAELDALKIELGSIDDSIDSSFTDLIDLAKVVFVEASKATAGTTPTPNPENPNPDTESPLPTPEDDSVTPLKF